MSLKKGSIMNEEKMKEVFSDEEFVKDLFTSKSFEEAQGKLKGKGIDVSIDEIKTVYGFIKKRIADKDCELTDEELESVAGGGTPTFLGGLSIMVVIPVVAGLLLM